MRQETIQKNIETVGILLYRDNMVKLENDIGRGVNLILGRYEEPIRDDMLFPDHEKAAREIRSEMISAASAARLYSTTSKAYVIGDTIFSGGIDAYLGIGLDELKKELKAEIPDYDSFLFRFISDRKANLRAGLKSYATSIVDAIIGSKESIISQTGAEFDIKERMHNRQQFFYITQLKYLTDHDVSWTPEAINDMLPISMIVALDHMINQTFSPAVRKRVFEQYIKEGIDMAVFQTPNHILDATTDDVKRAQTPTEMPTDIGDLKKDIGDPRARKTVEKLTNPSTGNIRPSGLWVP